MIFGLLVLITALCISAVAIYYSVAGLVAIFAAAALPIMIMGGVLEVSKLVTAVWLHKYWKQATWWLKSYLSVAVVVLMLITSMGIFGFLSKAHIEQTSASEESVARVQTIQTEIDRQIAIVGRSENRIRQLESSETGADANVQSQIDKEQDRIDRAFERIKPAIQEQNTIIADVTQLFQNELDKIDSDIETLQGYIDAGATKKAQQMIGASADGIFGKNTAEKIGDWQDAKRAERNGWLQKIQESANSPTVVAARDEIQRLRESAEAQVAQSQTLINRLQQQLANSDNAEEVQKSIDEQNERVRTASSEIEILTEERIGLESEYRKLEAEVGPIKYIAEFIYGESADNNMLEEAVRWVIIIIIFVFDPLAVLLLIAAQYTFEWKKTRKDDDGERLRLERARAQRIVDNPGFTPDDSVPPDNSSPSEDDGQKEEVNVTTTNSNADGDSRDVVPEDDTTDSNATTEPVEPDEVPAYEDVDQETLDKEFEEGVDRPLTEEQLSELEKTDEWTNAKNAWKSENPTLSLKFFKDLYLEGKIDELPWEKHLPKKSYIMKDNGKQVTKTTSVSPNANIGYIQNEEQQQSSIWKNIRGKDE